MQVQVETTLAKSSLLPAWLETFIDTSINKHNKNIFYTFSWSFKVSTF